MKKIPVLLSVLLILMLFGCGKRPEPVPETSASEPELSVSEAPAVPTKEEAAKNNAAINASNVHIIQFDDSDPGDSIAVINTTDGEIKVRLFYNQAPETVTAFESLVNSGFYNGQSFNNVVDGYKVECSVPGGDRSKFPEEPEFSLDLWNFRGAVSLADSGADFMIIQAPQCLNSREELEALNFPKKIVDMYLDIGGAPHQDWHNTVFGAVISGMEVVDKIAASPAGENGKPVNPVTITDIKITEAE